uniref:Transmembrane protein 144 n=1 Tax=Globodera rostochiensis TaxID=31243 RepID=A0A914HCL9_GLORO
MSVVLGLSACVVSSFCFGTMYVAVRRAGDPGDGMVVQWLVCSAIFLIGLLTYIFTGTPPFQHFAMFGGALWAVGNLTAIPIINAIGLGMGILIWGVCGCVVGWAIGRFGLFGLKESVPSSPNLNYAGLVFVIIGGILFALVRPKGKNDVQTVVDSASSELSRQAIPLTESAATGRGTVEERIGLVEMDGGGAERTAVAVDVVVRPRKSSGGAAVTSTNGLRGRVIGVVFSVFAGVCYGSMFTPVIYMQHNPQKFNNPPREAIHYVFSHFSGVYLTSTAVLLFYIGYKNNKPYIDSRLIFPSFLAGTFWAFAMLAWFMANDLLSQAITFPINSMAPGVIASLWSVFYFGEVDKKDLKLLTAAIFITIFGAILVGLSTAL